MMRRINKGMHMPAAWPGQLRGVAQMAWCCNFRLEEAALLLQKLLSVAQSGLRTVWGLSVGMPLIGQLPVSMPIVRGLAA